MLHVTPGRACHMLRRDRQTPLTPAKHTHTQPILPRLPLRNAKQRNAKQTVMLRVAYVTLGRLCQMLLRGAHVTRGRYSFLFARHETFLVQNLSQRCCCCAMTTKGITENKGMIVEQCNAFVARAAEAFSAKASTVHVILNCLE